MKRLLLISLLCISSQAFADPKVALTAQNGGVKSCLGAISQLEKFFGDNVRYGHWSQWAKEGADGQPFTTTMELTFSDGTHLIDLTVAPTADGNCTYEYTRTFFVDKTCIAASKESFMTGYEYKTELNQKISAFQKDNVKVFLMPAGDGCVVQKKEVGFRFKKQGEAATE